MRGSVLFEVRSFEVRSLLRFGHSRFGPIRGSVIRGSVIRGSVFRRSVFEVRSFEVRSFEVRSFGHGFSNLNTTRNLMPSPSVILVYLPGNQKRYFYSYVSRSSHLCSI